MSRLPKLMQVSSVAVFSPPVFCSFSGNTKLENNLKNMCGSGRGRTRLVEADGFPEGSWKVPRQCHEYQLLLGSGKVRGGKTSHDVKNLRTLWGGGRTRN